MRRKTLVESQLRTIVRSILAESDDPELQRAIEKMKKDSPMFWRYGGAIEVGPDGGIYAQVPEDEKFYNPYPDRWDPESGTFRSVDNWEDINKKRAILPPRPPSIPPEQHPRWRPTREKGVLPPHDSAEPFEKWAFAPQRKGTSLDVGEDEPNTPVEQIVYFELVDHLKYNKPVSPEVFQLLASMQKSGKYSDIFETLPPSTPIYRGVILSPKQLEKFGIEPLGQYAEPVTEEVDFMFGKKNSTSSWSLSPGTAGNFGMGDADNMRADDNIVMLTSTVGAAGMAIPMRGFYPISQTGYEDEQEVVCFGPVRVKEIYLKGKDSH